MTFELQWKVTVKMSEEKSLHKDQETKYLTIVSSGKKMVGLATNLDINNKKNNKTKKKTQ